jgi:hypothetical protein
MTTCGTEETPRSSRSVGTSLPRSGRWDRLLGDRPLIPLKAGADRGPLPKEGRTDEHKARYTHAAAISPRSSSARSQRIEIKAGLNFLSFRFEAQKRKLLGDGQVCGFRSAV